MVNLMSMAQKDAWDICAQVRESKTLHEFATEKLMNSCHGGDKKALKIGFC